MKARNLKPGIWMKGDEKGRKGQKGKKAKRNKLGRRSEGQRGSE